MLRFYHFNRGANLKCYHNKHEQLQESILTAKKLFKSSPRILQTELTSLNQTY